MHWLGLAVGVFVMAAAAFSLVAPDQLLSLLQSLMTPAGLVAIAVARVTVGLVLLVGAPVSRAPKTIRILGLIVAIAGFATPMFGIARAESVLKWWATVSPMLKALDSTVGIALGAFVVYAFSTRPQING